MNGSSGTRSHGADRAARPTHLSRPSSECDASDSDALHASFAARVFAPASEWYEEMQWSRSKPKLSARASMELVASYTPDWILTILTAGLLQLINRIYGFRREFSLTDTSLQHTYTVHERVSVGLLAVIAFVIPLALIAAISLGVSRSFWDFHAGFLGLVVAHALTLAATAILKVSVGRPRPDLIARCQPRAGAADGVPFGLATEAVCTTDTHSHLISDGFRSFPSGHSSTAFAGLTFLSLWLAGKVHIWQRGRGSAASAWLLFVPMFGATMIAVSRTMDYRHHATDVIAGGILGFVIALSTYHNYYPPLWYGESQKPWSPRTSLKRRGYVYHPTRTVAGTQQREGGTAGAHSATTSPYDAGDVEEAADSHFASSADGRTTGRRKLSTGEAEPATMTPDVEQYPLARAPSLGQS